MTEISAGHAGILSGSVTAPVPLKNEICGGSDQVGLRLSITFWQDLEHDEMGMSQAGLKRTSGLFSDHSYETTGLLCIQEQPITSIHPTVTHDAEALLCLP